jgi:hypothetical protein
VNTMLMSIPVRSSSSSCRSMSSSKVVSYPLLHPSLLLHWDHQLDGVEVLISLRLGPSSYVPSCWIVLWLGVRPGGHQRDAGAIPDVVVLDVLFYPEPNETGCSGLGNRTVLFGGYRELVSASVLVSASTSETLSCSAATSLLHH